MAGLLPCISKAKLDSKVESYLHSAAKGHIAAGMPEREAYLKAAKDLQEHALNTIHDIYNQVGVPGYEKPSTPIVSEKVKNKLSQLKSKQNASTSGEGQQQTGDQQSSLSEHARTQQAGGKRKTTGAKSSDSDKRGEGGQKEVTKKGAVEKAAPDLKSVIPFDKSQIKELSAPKIPPITNKELPVVSDNKVLADNGINDYEAGKISGEELKDIFIKNGVSEEYLSRKMVENGVAKDLELPEPKPVTNKEVQPKAPAKRFTQKIAEKAKSELDDLWDELSDLSGKQGITPNPEDEIKKSLLSLRIVAKATEAGIYKFADIVALGFDKLGKNFDALFTYVRDAYLAFQGRASDEVLEQMDNTKEVRNFDYEQFKNDGNDTIISDTDGEAQDGMDGNKQSTGTKGTRTIKQTQSTSGKPSRVGKSSSSGINEEGPQQGGGTTGGTGINSGTLNAIKPATTDAGQGISDYQVQTGRLKPLPTNPADQNHIIGPSDIIVPEGNPAKVTANMDAVILLRKLESENRNATPEEKKELAKFVGWGGLADYLKGFEENEAEKQIFDNIFLGIEQNVGYYNRQTLPATAKLDIAGKTFDQIVKESQVKYAQLIAQFPTLGRHVNTNRAVSGIPAGGHLPLDLARKYVIPYLMNAAEFQAAGASTINAHYTDRSIITPIWELIRKLGFTGGNTLESSAGIGHFFGLMPKDLQETSNLTGVELDSLTGRILKKLYPDANIQVKGFETTNFPNNSFDLAVSNVPFAKEGLVTDPRNKDIDKFNLHNYFIAKNLKQLKPGGIAVMITSKSTMDNAVSAKARRWFLSPEGGNSELVGAVRLPNNAFDKNAATQVTTDIMVFQKRKGPIVKNTNPFAATEMIRSEVIDGEVAEINVNEYYIANPDNMIGEMKYAFEVGSGGLYGKTDATLHAKPGTDIGAKVKELFDKFPTDILDTDYSPADTNISTNTKPGKMFVEKGKVYISNGEQGVELFLKPEQKKIALDYLGVRDAVRDLVAKELSDASADEIEADRAALNKTYDAFVKKHGTINKNNFLYDHDIEFSIAAAAEDVKETTIISTTGGRAKKSVEVKKAAIFSKRLNFPRTEPDTAENLSDAIQISLAYRNHINHEYIASIMGITPAQAIERMIDQKLVFQNPATALLETPEEYLSGNVRKKYNEAKEAAATDADYTRNVIELEKIQPEDKAISQIPFKMGVSWIPASMYMEFIKEKLGVDIKITYLDKAGIWALNRESMKGERDTNNTNTYAVGRETGIDIIADIMANRSTVINDTVYLPGGGTSIRKNEVQTEAAAQMQDKIVDEFRQWVATHETHGQAIEREYNDRFNNLVEKTIKAPPFDHFPGASTASFKLRLHQLKAILRGLSGNPLLLAHSVGTGKTAIMQTIAMEWRRLKTAKKPMIVVQNSTLKDFAAKFHKLYPGANLLVSSEADKGEAERRRFYARITQGDWDAIIIPQSQFDRIPDNPDRVAAFLQERIEEMQQVLGNSTDGFVKAKLIREIEDLQEDINQAYMTKEELAAIKTKSSDMYVDENTGKVVQGEAPGKKRGGKQKVKAAAEKILKLNARVQKQAERRTDNVMYFEDMGIDGLIVDEAHEYKKLGFQTGLQNIRGIDTGFSKRALSLSMKGSAVREKTGGKNIVYATGTPITNTMAESWTMMRFLQPEVLEEMGIQYFDQFAATFTEVVPSLEQNAGGRFEVVERMKEFVNAKQLQAVFKKMADVVTTDDIPEFVSDPENAPPALKGGGFEMVLIPISNPMKTTMRRLADHYDWWKSLTGKEKKELSYLPLVLYQIAKKASIDLRLIDPRLVDDPESKVNYAVKNALGIYKEYDQYKATQMIFSDSFQSGNSAIVHQILNVPGGLKPFNLYEDIKKKLIAGGVPPSEIIVMSDVKSDAGKEQMMNKMNSGEVRFVIGSTAKMGIGINAHERMIALHHIDAPDRPDQFTQRNGRLIRPGNMFTKLKIPVQVLTYGIKDTRDATSYGRLRDKEKFVSDFMSGKGGDRVEDTGEEDEAGNAGDFFSEMSAQLSGSKYATELIFAEKDLRTERNKAEAFKQRKEESEFKLHNKISGRESIKDSIKKADDALVLKKAAFPDNKITSLGIGGKEITEKLTEALDNLIDDTAKEYQVENLRLDKEATEAGLKSRKIPKAKLVKFKINGLEANYTYEKPYEELNAVTIINIPSLEMTRPAGSNSAASILSVVRNYIRDIDDQPQRYRDLLKKEEHNIETLKKNLAETYDKDKLDELVTRVSYLKAAVLAESKEKEALEKKEVADKKAEEEKKKGKPGINPQVKTKLDSEVEEIKDIILDLIDDGITSLKKIEDLVVSELGENMRPLVREAYNEATKEVKIADTNGEGQPIKNELTTSFAKRINNFIDNIFGKSPTENTVVLKDTQALMDKAAELGANTFQNINGSTEAFYSPLEKFIEASKQGAFTVEQILGQIKSLPQVEIEAVGLKEFLRGKNKVTKQELLDYVRENKVNVEVIEKKDEINTADTLLLKDKHDTAQRVKTEIQDKLGGEKVYISGIPATWMYKKNGKPTEVPKEYHEKLDKAEEAIGEYENFISDDNGMGERGETKYGQYTLPGEKSNYREVLLTLGDRLPSNWEVLSNKEFQGKYNKDKSYPNQKAAFIIVDEKGTPQFGDVSKAAVLDKLKLREEGKFKSSHFDEPNIIAHIRLTDRTTPDGKRILFVEEAQSDWAREGRKKGFIKPNEKLVATRIANEYWRIDTEDGRFVTNVMPYDAETKEAALKEAQRRVDEGLSSAAKGIPDLPFKNNWQELATKKSIQIAAQEGYDGIAWINGEQTKDRYDLSKHLSSIEWSKNKDGTYDWKAFSKENPDSLIDHDNVATLDSIEKSLGKEIADKIKQSAKPKDVIAEEGLKIGGKWANNLYDKQIPKLVEKYSKQLGGNVTNYEFTEGKWHEEDGRNIFEGADGTYIGDYSKQRDGKIRAVDMFGKEKIVSDVEAAKDYIAKSTNFHRSNQFGLEITPDMKASTQSLPMFMKNEKGEVLGFTHNGKIYLNGEHLNPNTPVHEAGHIWVEWAKDFAENLYNRGIELIKNSEYLARVKANNFYKTEAEKLPEDERESYYQHEALAAAIGDKGAQFIVEAKKKSFAEWAKELWNKIGQALGFKNVTAEDLQDMSLDEFAKRAAVDILKGQPQQTTEEKQQEFEEPEEGPLRRFTKQVLTDEAIIPKGEIAKKLVYVVQKNAISVEEATDIINQIGVDAAWELVVHDKDLKGAVRVVMGQMLIKKFNTLAAKAKDEETKNYYIDKTVEAADYVTEKLATDAGQQIQAFSLYAQLSPEAQLRSAIKDIKKQAEARGKRRQKDLLRIARELNRVNEETAEELTASPKVQQTVEKTEKSRIERAGDKIQKARDRRQKLIEKHKADKGKNLYSAPGLTSEGIEFVGNLAKTYIDEGIANLEVIAGRIIEHLKTVTGKDVNNDVINNIRDIVQPLVEKVQNKRITTGLHELEKEIHRIIKEHYSVTDQQKSDLIDKFIDQTGLDREDAIELAASIQTEFDKIATRKKQDLFDKEKKRFDRIKNALAGAKTPDKKTLEDEIIRLSNLGTVDNDALLELLSDKLGTGAISPEQGKRIEFLAERIKDAPEGSPTREAVEDLLAYRAKLKGTSWGEVAQGVWYANVLSGYLTHIKNIVSTFFNGISFFAVEVAADPKSLPILLYGGAKGFKRGAIEAWHTLSTGRSPIHIYKVETPQVLERITFKGGLLNPANYLKYVSRLMIAEDVLQFQGLKEMRATQLAYREAKLAGHRNPFSKETWKVVNEKLLNTKERLEEATEQTEEEGFTGRDARRRIYELMELSRPIEMTEAAYGFAAKGTFNHDTEGSLGALTDALGRMIDNSLAAGGSKPLRFVIPFTRIITNVTNNALDFSPLGFVRAGFNRRGLLASAVSGKRREMTEEERRQTLVKASLGIVSMAALYTLARLGTIAISGAGPDDNKKRQQLIEEGWQPFSIKIGNKWYSYKLTPMVFAWGIVGSMRDNEEYGREDDQTAGKRVALAAWDGVKLISDMTWINSAAPVMSAISSGNPNEAGAILSNSGKNIAKGFFLPNAFTQGAERVEQIFNVPQKQANNLYENLIMNVPIARNSLNDKINALGDPIVKDVDILVSPETKDPVWKFLLDNKGWVAPVNKNTIIVFDITTQQERPISNEEYYQFSKVRGQKIRAAIENIMANGVYAKTEDGKEKFTINPDESEYLKNVTELTTKEFNKVLTLYETAATEQTKKELNFNEDE